MGRVSGGRTAAGVRVHILGQGLPSSGNAAHTQRRRRMHPSLDCGQGHARNIAAGLIPPHPLILAHGGASGGVDAGKLDLAHGRRRQDLGAK